MDQAGIDEVRKENPELADIAEKMFALLDKLGLREEFEKEQVVLKKQRAAAPWN